MSSRNRHDQHDETDPDLAPDAEGAEEAAPSVEDLSAAAEAAEQELQGDARLRTALEEKAREAAEAQDRYLRTYADFENYRKRMQRDLADFRKYANEQMAADLLTVADHLGLAIQHAADSGEANQGLLTGVQLVHKQLRDVLEKH